MNAATTAIRHSKRRVPVAAEASRGRGRNGMGFLASLGCVSLLALAQSGAAWAQTAPSLGAAGPYAITASTLSNTGSTVVIGDVCFTTGPGTALVLTGTSVTPCSGTNSTPGTVLGDETTALGDLNGQPCTDIAGAVTLDMFMGGIIPPGCYNFSGAITTTGSATVTLNGNGVYIFRSGTSLTTGAGSTFSLTNGAAAGNVFWAPVAATTLGANSSIVGTIIDEAGITLGNNVDLQGRVLASNATVTSNADTINLPAAPPPVIPVPTLWEWALIMFAGLLAIAGFAATRRPLRSTIRR